MIKQKSLAFKILLSLFSIAIIATTLATGTFASFSATYIWQSNQGTVGTFDYTDTTLSINMFRSDPIYPSNSGSSKLTGADFGDKTLSWGFSEINTNSIPILFYVFDGTANTGFYSSYDYATNFTDSFIKLGSENYIGCSQISTDSANFASEFAIGYDVCWVWPDKFFEYTEGSYNELTNESSNNFSLYNENLCKTMYSYSYDNTEVLEQLSNTQNLFNYIATSTITQGYTIESLDAANVTVLNDLLYINDKYLQLYSESASGFITPTSAYSLSNNDYYLLYSSAISVSKIIDNMSLTSLSYNIVGNTTGNTDFTPYYRNTDYSTIVETNNGYTEKPILKLYPCSAIDNAAAISVEITAEVSI